MSDPIRRNFTLSKKIFFPDLFFPAGHFHPPSLPPIPSFLLVTVQLHPLFLSLPFCSQARQRASTVEPRYANSTAKATVASMNKLVWKSGNVLHLNHLQHGLLAAYIYRSSTVLLQYKENYCISPPPASIQPLLPLLLLRAVALDLLFPPPPPSSRNTNPWSVAGLSKRRKVILAVAVVCSCSDLGGFFSCTSSNTTTLLTVAITHASRLRIIFWVLVIFFSFLLRDSPFPIILLLLHAFAPHNNMWSVQYKQNKNAQITFFKWEKFIYLYA